MSKPRRGKCTNQTGRTKQKVQFVPISYPMADSAAWRSLNGAAVKVYIELRSRYNGGNNGDLSLSLDKGARRLGLGKATIQRALEELEAKGFIRLSKRGSWYGRRASTFVVTDRPMSERLPPTNDWRQWEPPNAGRNLASVLQPSENDPHELSTEPSQ